MRIALPLLSSPTAPLVIGFFATLRARLAPPPPARARPAVYSLPLRVQVALRAAARARR